MPLMNFISKDKQDKDCNYRTAIIPTLGSTAKNMLPFL